MPIVLKNGDTPTEKKIDIDVVIPIEALLYIDRLVQMFGAKCWTYDDIQGQNSDFRDRIVKSINATEWAIFILLNAVADAKVQGNPRLNPDHIKKIFRGVVSSKASIYFTLDMMACDDYRILLHELITQVLHETKLF